MFHACLYSHTLFVWADGQALQSGQEVTLPLLNIPHGSDHACHMLCTVYHSKWHACTDANSVATHQFQVPVYMVCECRSTW